MSMFLFLSLDLTRGHINELLIPLSATLSLFLFSFFFKVSRSVFCKKL